MDLGVASKAITGEKGVEAVEVELEDGVDVINRDYDEALDSLSMKPEAVREVTIIVEFTLFPSNFYLPSYIEPSTQNKARRLLPRFPYSSSAELDWLQCIISSLCNKR